MKVIVLGGSGLQGRAALQDLGKSDDVTEIVCADVNFAGVNQFRDHLAIQKMFYRKVDITSEQNVASLFREGADVVIDLLPKQFNDTIAKAAVEFGIPMVNCSYANGISKETYEKALENQVTIMPEAGLDPGIDLVLCGYGVSQLDEVHELYSYCGGIPEPEASYNPLRYKISWNFNSTLMSYQRKACMLRGRKVIDIPASHQHDQEWVENITIGELSDLETIPNGDAIQFASLLGIEKELINTERRTIRWAGHASFWRSMVQLGFLTTDPVPGFDCDVTPYEFLLKHLEPRLQYKTNEKDLVLMKNIIRGKKNGKSVELIYEMVDERDLETGLFAMNKTVGYTASIVAQMVGNKTITKPGVLSPTTDIPYEMFIKAIEKRGITINEQKNIWNGT
ncbi:saccharopine dehydrogenase family protein [Virgibacillus pantothenticus]|uniref:saccharopine dehydrogenase family protein n=1 Tax=Virgibacillus pantothenticus TaxID=1473 RepID=UPI000984A297|nr:saccharopine dehydrogenase C-terminal domain-containing protein [Virgibacillus pantothenticus]